MRFIHQLWRVVPMPYGHAPAKQRVRTALKALEPKIGGASCAVLRDADDLFAVGATCADIRDLAAKDVNAQRRSPR